MLLNKSAAKVQHFFDICKFFCIFSVIHDVKDLVESDNQRLSYYVTNVVVVLSPLPTN